MEDWAAQVYFSDPERLDANEESNADDNSDLTDELENLNLSRTPSLTPREQIEEDINVVLRDQDIGALARVVPSKNILHWNNCEKTKELRSSKLCRQRPSLRARISAGAEAVRHTIRHAEGNGLPKRGNDATDDAFLRPSVMTKFTRTIWNFCSLPRLRTRRCDRIASGSTSQFSIRQECAIFPKTIHIRFWDFAIRAH